MKPLVAFWTLGAARLEHLRTPWLSPFAVVDQLIVFAELQRSRGAVAAVPRRLALLLQFASKEDEEVKATF